MNLRQAHLANAMNQMPKEEMVTEDHSTIAGTKSVWENSYQTAVGAAY
jgi:hypothetical protein